jgi:hypothetical protein
MSGPITVQPVKPHNMAKYRTCKSAFDFETDMAKAAQVLGIESARDLTVALALAVDTRIVQGTPVDTGRAQANWFMSEGVMRTDTTESKTPEARPRLTGNTVIFIANSLPYIVPLEYGHSSQAPQGMVRKALAEVAAISIVGGRL